MVYGFVERSKQKPTWHEIVHAIMRNFGGLDEVDAVESFRKNLATLVHIETEVNLDLVFIESILSNYYNRSHTQFPSCLWYLNIICIYLILSNKL